ncbi:hypothetical protein RRG08_050061 [Elysia crispata]|uniref:Uncharacterized protein n=1 Tax=Elysia crispata TaxID=231223 RepID=A0AAE1E0K2_9GAST|nr:hypothetical protein RRG08_050061 [Elysia crispata]
MLSTALIIIRFIIIVKGPSRSGRSAHPSRSFCSAQRAQEVPQPGHVSRATSPDFPDQIPLSTENADKK